MVVPYNPYLLANFNCRMNVEICSTIKVVKYTYKYIYKGHDKIHFAMYSDDRSKEIDKIKEYQSARWVSPIEAIWRIHRFPLFETHPVVINLQLHLENYQSLTLKDDADLRDLLERPTSFDDLKTVDGVYVNTFREAAIMRGLFEPNNPQEQCLEEAALYHMPYSFRRLFATLLVYFTPADPRSLWLKFKESMSEDFNRTLNLSSDQVQHKVLYEISKFLESMGKNINMYGLVPRILKFDEIDGGTRDTSFELSFKVNEENIVAISKLNKDKQVAFDTIIDALFVHYKGSFFIDGPGGTGKTFLYCALLAAVRSKGCIALATAFCGVAASILPGGRIAHS
ncbi:uncharacterized protein [Coffea arabica]|uniref:ATP-dependent DNA helicase n=1 Tax=Coffea arabica TaxID=13443 RepID=A0ABM4VM58_COFAR